MSDHGYEVFADPYCCRGTFVLKNRAGLKDAKRLQAFELEMSSLRADEPLPEEAVDVLRRLGAAPQRGDDEREPAPAHALHVLPRHGHALQQA